MTSWTRCRRRLSAIEAEATNRGGREEEEEEEEEEEFAAETEEGDKEDKKSLMELNQSYKEIRLQIQQQQSGVDRRWHSSISCYCLQSMIMITGM